MEPINKLSVFMMNVFYYLVLIVIMSGLSSTVLAQRVDQRAEYSFTRNNVEEYKMTSFKAKQIEGKVYIIWTVLEPSDNCFYQLERSTNNKDFEVIYVTEGAKSPANLELINSFTDDNVISDKVYYRVKRYSNDKKIIVSTSFPMVSSGSVAGNISTDNCDYLTNVQSAFVANEL